MTRFFDPTDEVLDWLAGYAAGRPVVEVGCGDCNLVRKLAARGVRVLGVDPLWQGVRMPIDLMSCVLGMSVLQTKITHAIQNGLVLFCRPCHGGFVQTVAPLFHRTTEVLYVGKPDNLWYDWKFPDAVQVPSALDTSEMEERAYLLLNRQIVD